MSSTLGLTAAQVEIVLETAAQAPSRYAVPPWRFVLRPELIELHADPQHVLLAADPDGRELRLSCGAALFNLRLALHELGIRPLVTLLPNGLDRRGSHALAVIRHGGRVRAVPELVRLLDAVPAVLLVGEPIQDVPVSAAQRAALTRAVEAERSWLHTVADAGDLVTLQDLVGRARWAQRPQPVERAARGGPGDAVPIGASREPGGPAEPSPLDVARPPIVPTGRAEPDPFVVMVCSFQRGQSAELQSGQALQRLLLTAATLGLAGASLSEPLAVPDLRTELRRKLGTPLHPHAILRLGRGTPASHPPSRSAADLVPAEPARS